MLQHKVLGLIPKWCLCISQLWSFLCSPVEIVSFWFCLFSFTRVCMNKIKSRNLCQGFCRLHWEFNSSAKVLTVHFCALILQVQIHTALHLAHTTTNFCRNLCNLPATKFCWKHVRFPCGQTNNRVALFCKGAIEYCHHRT